MTHVHVCPVAWRAHEDPVRLGGLGGLRQEVRPLVVVAQDIGGGGVTVAPAGWEERLGKHGRRKGRMEEVGKACRKGVKDGGKRGRKSGGGREGMQRSEGWEE